MLREARGAVLAARPARAGHAARAATVVAAVAAAAVGGAVETAGAVRRDRRTAGADAVDRPSTVTLPREAPLPS